MHSVRRCVTRGTRSLPLQPRASIIARVCRKCVCRVCVCTRACVYYISKCPYATRQTIESPEAIASETQRSSPLSNVNNRRNNTKQKRNTIKKKKKLKKRTRDILNKRSFSPDHSSPERRRSSNRTIDFARFHAMSLGFVEATSDVSKI